MTEHIFKDILELKTPVGYFSVFDSEGLVPFSVVKNTYNPPYEIYDSDNESIIDFLTTETNYEVLINVDDLKIGNTYHIYFSGGVMDICGYDEHTEVLTVTRDGWSVGIGAYNPNDEEELEQAIEYSKRMGYYEKRIIIQPSTYDESKMNSYRVAISDNSRGFTFKYLDNSRQIISFPIAWIKNEKYNQDEYEEALFIWLS